MCARRMQTSPLPWGEGQDEGKRPLSGRYPFRTPRESELGLLRIGNAAGLEISALPNGCLFAIEHDDGRGRRC